MHCLHHTSFDICSLTPSPLASTLNEDLQSENTSSPFCGSCQYGIFYCRLTHSGIFTLPVVAGLRGAWPFMSCLSYIIATTMSSLHLYVLEHCEINNGQHKHQLYVVDFVPFANVTSSVQIERCPWANLA